MGRVKEQLLEENWIEDEQEKIIDKNLLYEIAKNNI